MNPPGEVRVQLVLHYDGSRFFGWQLQPHGRTVQGELHAALQRLTGAPGRAVGAGRTDRGVHAKGQVAAVDVPARWDAASLRRALNAVLPDDLWVRTARIVHPDFHPRYDATGRTYEYRVGVDEIARSPFHRPWCWPLCVELDRSLLDRSAAILRGEHAFGAFAKSGQPERGVNCTVRDATWAPWNGMGLSFRITANRYLHHMVRYLVGTMVDVARKRRPPDDVATLLSESRRGLETSPPAPPEGLFLTEVEYPPEALALEPARRHDRKGTSDA